jgi:hypothetical protein
LIGLGPRDPAVSYPQRRRNVNNILQIILNLTLPDTKSDSASIRGTFHRFGKRNHPQHS